MHRLRAARLQESIVEGDDCPYCWRECVEGVNTGTASGFAPVAPGGQLPKAVANKRYTCPSCGETWASGEYGRLVRRFL